MTHTSSESLQVSGPKCTPNLPLALPLAKETQPSWPPRSCEAVLSPREFATAAGFLSAKEV